MNGDAKGSAKAGPFLLALCKFKIQFRALGSQDLQYVKISIKLREFSKNMLETIREHE